MERINFLYAVADEGMEFLNMIEGDKIKILIPKWLRRTIKEFEKGYIPALYEGNGYFYMLDEDGSVNYSKKYHLLTILILFNNEFVREEFKSLPSTTSKENKRLVERAYESMEYYKLGIRVAPIHINYKYEQLIFNSIPDLTRGCGLYLNPKNQNPTKDTRRDGKMVIQEPHIFQNKWELKFIMKDRLEDIDLAINYLTPDERNSLFEHCAYKNNIKAARLLVKKGVDSEYFSDFAMYHALDKNHVNFIKYLIKLGADLSNWGEKALKQAATDGCLPLFKIFWEAYPEGHAKASHLLDLAIIYDSVNILNFLDKQGYVLRDKEETLLNFAASYGSVKSIKYLVKTGSDIHVDNEKVLLTAVSSGEAKAVACLVELGADISAQNFKAVRKAKYKEQEDILDYFEEFGKNSKKLKSLPNYNYFLEVFED